ncbi:MAG: geranylgeranylglyceryl/heptaprenylglyceryl phosphate synthase [Haloferacaceae archaeon]
MDTNPVPSDWTHITKIDPEPEKLLPLLYPLYLQHTDAVSVGGSRSVDGQTTEETFRILEWSTVPTFHEPSAAEHVTGETLDRAAFLAIPEVLNGDATALVGTLGEGIDYVRSSLAPRELSERLPFPIPTALQERLAEFLTSWLLHGAVFEAYIIQNPASAAAREANVSAEDVLSIGEARRRGMAAERHLGSEIIYLEYSGTYGGEEAVETIGALDASTGWSRIWYGGGLTSNAEVSAIRDAGADTVVVGDVFHEIACEERALCRRAADALEVDADRPTIREWIEQNVDLTDSAPVQYLDTIVETDGTSSVVREYLTTTIRTWFYISERKGGDPHVDARRIDSMATDVPQRHLPEVSRDGLRTYLRELVRSFSDRPSAEGSLPTSHLSLPDGDVETSSDET